MKVVIETVDAVYPADQALAERAARAWAPYAALVHYKHRPRRRQWVVRIAAPEGRAWLDENGVACEKVVFAAVSLADGARAVLHQAEHVAEAVDR